VRFPQCDNDAFRAQGKIEDTLLPDRVGSVFAHRPVGGKPVGRVPQSHERDPAGL
jgi:hypothetical protein